MIKTHTSYPHQYKINVKKKKLNLNYGIISYSHGETINHDKGGKMSANILIVDDDKLHTKMLMSVLKEESHNIFVSYDGKDLFSILDKHSIDVILLDIILPAIDGFDLLQVLMSHEDFKKIPVIMITALTTAKHVKRALDIGAMDYIRKPAEPIEVIARVHSALRLKAKIDLIEEASVRDSLTKLYNRAYCQKMLYKWCFNIEKFKSGIAYAMIDCDHFKRINDVYGHVSGDFVLASVGNTILKSTKSTDISGRYGGEEFCIIMPNTSLEQGILVCNRIIQNIQKVKHKLGEHDVSVTVSIGVSHTHEGRQVEAVKLIDEADRALYKAKAEGRNKVEFHTVKEVSDAVPVS